MIKRSKFFSYIVLAVAFTLWGSFLLKEHDKISGNPPAEVNERVAGNGMLSPASGENSVISSSTSTLPPSISEDGANHEVEYDFPLSDEDVFNITTTIFPFEAEEGQLENQKAAILREADVIRVLLSDVKVKWLPTPIWMEVVIDPNTASVLVVDAFRKSTNTVSDSEWDVKVSDEEAISIAKSAIGKLKYNEILSIRTEHLTGDIIRVVFPFSTWKSDTGYIIGPKVQNHETAKLYMQNTRPPDSIEYPNPLDEPVYVIAWFHTHTSTEYRSGGVRPIGPSSGDHQYSVRSGV